MDKYEIMAIILIVQPCEPSIRVQKFSHNSVEESILHLDSETFSSKTIV